MKLSIITVCYNAASTIEDAIKSVLSQDYPDIEYIVIDGNSTDGTQKIIEKYTQSTNCKITKSPDHPNTRSPNHPITQSPNNQISKCLSEPDEGIYDAMNKGISMATGEVVGILNADDFYADDSILSQVMELFQKPAIDAVFGDLIFVDPNDLDKTVRSYRSHNWHPDKFSKGYMPAHPTFFVRRRYYEKFGLFETDYEIAADYEMLIRLLYVHKLNYMYLPLVMVKMRKGGVSSRGIKSNITLNNEIIRACRKHGIKTSAFKIYPKYFRKIFELINF